MHDLIIGSAFAAIIIAPCLTAQRAIRQTTRLVPSPVESAKASNVISITTAR